MSKYITVWYKNEAVSILTEVADQLGLRDQQHINTDRQLVEIIRQNCAMMIAKLSTIKAQCIEN